MKNSMRAVFATAIAAAGFVLASAGDVQAAPFTFSCPSGADCHGATYGLKLTDVTSLGGGLFAYEVTLGIDTTGYSGDSGDFIHAVSFKDLVSGFTDLSLTSAPGGLAGWTFNDSGLDADGCKLIAAELGACAEAAGFGAGVSPAGEFFWKFTFLSTDATPGPTGQIKFLYVDDELKNGDYKKVGGLGGFTVPLQPPDTQTVPEPATMALFGLALAASAGRHYRSRMR